MTYLTVKIHSQKTSESVVGIYRPENHIEIQFYQEPNYQSKIIEKKLINDKDLGWVYQVEGIVGYVHQDIGLCGWEKFKDKINKETWIKLSEDKSVWAPFKYYVLSESEMDYESDVDYDFDLYTNI